MALNPNAFVDGVKNGFSLHIEPPRISNTFNAINASHDLGIIVYSYLMPACSIVKTITPRCRGRPDALLHEAEGRVQ